MKVVLLSETYPRRMGYLVTMLPRYMAALGAEVHLVVMDLPPYHYMSGVRAAAGDFFADQIPKAGSTIESEGYTVHVLGHKRRLGYVAFVDLCRLLNKIRPDIVYSSVAIGWIPLQAWWCRRNLGFQLFTGSHTSRAVFPLAGRPRPWLGLEGLRCLLQRWIPGRLVSWSTRTCYAPTADCGEIAARFFGVQKKKVRTVHLGVDFDVFYPVISSEELSRRELSRRELGFSPHDIVCIYTGKIEPYKRVDLLADAVHILRSRGEPFRLLVVGSGSAAADLGANHPEVQVLDFVPYEQLGRFYRACDLAVWPFGESTSMLDAAACGLPIVVSDAIYQEHVTGNGFSCDMRNARNLADVLSRLADRDVRRSLGEKGAKKMRASFDWRDIADRRLKDFEAAMHD